VFLAQTTRPLGVIAVGILKGAQVFSKKFIWMYTLWMNFGFGFLVAFPGLFWG
jgi:hypothetical protein